MISGGSEQPFADILVVDDTPANLQLLTGLLRERGYRVRAALNGALALGAVEQRPPELILLDIKMPEMDGFEVCAELKRWERSRDIPIIFISALDDPRDKVRAFESGGVDYITKPFEEAEVVARVGTQLAVARSAHELERRVAERTAELGESERRLREAQRLAHMGNWELDLAGDSLFWSEEIYRIFGVEPEGFEATYEAFLDRVHPDDRARVEETFGAAVDHDRPYDLTHRIIRRDDGRVRHVHERSRQIRDPSGRVTRSAGTVQDVTEMERANRILRTRSAVNLALLHGTEERGLLERICRILVETAGFRLVWVGFLRDGSQERVERVARAGADTRCLEGPEGGAFAEGAIARALGELRPVVVGDVEREPWFAPWREAALNSGHRSLIALPLVMKEELLGVLTLCSGETEAFDEAEVALLQEVAGDLFYGVHTLRVRSALREHQEHLEELVEARTAELSAANERLLELDRLKSMFIASVSHELRTPLNSIIGFSGMMLQNIGGTPGERHRDYLRRLNGAGKHLLALISDVIDISKIEAGRIEARVTPCELEEVVTEAVEGVRPEAEGKGLALSAEVEPGVALRTDRARLLQCLLNLLGNAVKYTEAGGVRVAARARGERVEVVVSDTGIGIAEGDRERLFQPFERLSSHLKVKAGGTGLGLYLTRKLVNELLGGAVSLESRPGEGSTFRLEFSRDLGKR